MLKSALPVGSPRLGAAANLRFLLSKSLCPELRISTDKVEQNLPSINPALLAESRGERHVSSGPQTIRYDSPINTDTIGGYFD